LIDLIWDQVGVRSSCLSNQELRMPSCSPVLSALKLMHRADRRGEQIRRAGICAKKGSKAGHGRLEQGCWYGRGNKRVPQFRIGFERAVRSSRQPLISQERGRWAGVWKWIVAVGGPLRGYSSGSGERFSSGNG